MDNNDPVLLNRRRILYAALMGGGSAALAACAPGDETGGSATGDIWAGFDGRITERTLAEAEKIFGLAFSESERQQILGGPVEEA